MIAFVVLAGLLVVGALLLLLPPLVGGRRRVTVEGQAEAALAVLRDELTELEADRAAGRIDAEAYARARDELERRALAEGDAPAAGAEAPADGRPAPRWALAVALGLPLAAAALYLALGTPAGLDPAQEASAPARPSRAQIEKMVSELAARLENEPDNIEGWQMLGRAYFVLGDYARAAQTYERLAKRQPANADVLAEWAEAVAAGAGGKVAGEPERLAERALAIAPNQVKGLALAGRGAFERGDYKTAAERWERILAQSPPDPEVVKALRAGIDEARSRAGLPPLAQEEPAAPAAASPLRLHGTVRLAPALAAKAAPGDSVFVFVRAVDGRMPLAGVRLTVADLPAPFDFSRVPLLAAGNGLPSRVVVGARVSKSGQPMAASGDLEGFSAAVAPDAGAVDVIIDRTH